MYLYPRSLRSRRGESALIPIGLLAAVVMIVVGIGVVAIRHRSSVSVVSQSVTWELKINVERFQPVQQNSWDLPPDARDVTTHYEVHHSYTYVSGSKTTCTGTGKSKTCSTYPTYSTGYVYRDKYYYTVDRWALERIAQASGVDFNDSWPDVSDLKEPRGPVPAIGDERAGMRTSHYQVTFVDDSGRQYPVDVIESMWRQFKPGTRAHLELNIFGTVMGVGL